MGHDCVPILYVVLIMLCGGVVKGSALPVAACVAGQYPWHVRLCLYLCASLGYALNLATSRTWKQESSSCIYPSAWVGEPSEGLKVCWTRLQ